MAKSINKTIAVLMVMLMVLQSLALWPPWEARQDGVKLSLRAVVPLPSAVGILPDVVEESDSGEDIHRCRNPDSESGTKKVLSLRVNTGYRIRDQTA